MPSTDRVWRLSFHGAELRGFEELLSPAERTPAPDAAAAHAVADRWGAEGLADAFPALGAARFWWTARFALHAALLGMLGPAAVLRRASEAGGPPARIVLETPPPHGWWLPLLRGAAPDARIETPAPPAAPGARAEQLRWWALRLRRAVATERRIARLPAPDPRRPRVLLLSRDRLWNGERDEETHSVERALRDAGCDVLLMSTSLHRFDAGERAFRTRPETHLFADALLPRHLLRRGLPKAPPFTAPGRFEAEGVDWAAIVAPLCAGWLRDWHPQQRVALDAFPPLLRRLGVRAAVLTDENGGSQALKMGLLAGGIPVVALQHGIIHADHLHYAFPRGTAPEEVPLPTLTCVYGAHEERLLVDGSIYPAASVAPVGQPQTDALCGLPRWRARSERGEARRRALLPAGCDTLLLYTSQGLYRDSVVPMLLRAVAAAPASYALLVRPHPSEAGGFWERALAAHGLAERARVDASGGIAEALDACDVHLSISSTVLSEAVLHGRPNIVAGASQAGDPHGILGRGVATVLGEGDSLERLVAEWLAKPADEVAAAREAFIRERYGPVDGQVGRRVAERVLALL
ncbi:MAG: hypothetical protein SF028_02125 [Candidatus Sumerlaeia bacterium]|nr:hypothetical protein [Candidatus Sumerlaeia bacterium]